VIHANFRKLNLECNCYNNNNNNNSNNNNNTNNNKHTSNNNRCGGSRRQSGAVDVGREVTVLGDGVEEEPSSTCHAIRHSQCTLVEVATVARIWKQAVQLGTRVHWHCCNDCTHNTPSMCAIILLQPHTTTHNCTQLHTTAHNYTQPQQQHATILTMLSPVLTSESACDASRSGVAHNVSGNITVGCARAEQRAIGTVHVVNHLTHALVEVATVLGVRQVTGENSGRTCYTCHITSIMLHCQGKLYICVYLCCYY
jgi:hypothetical protein